MKKVKVLFSAFAVVALAAGLFAAKASTSDVVYLPNQQRPDICDVQANFTVQPHGVTIGTSATLIPGAPCTLLNYYQPF